MQKPWLALAFMAAILLHPTAPGTPTANAQTLYLSDQVSASGLVVDGFARIEATGAISDIEIVRNEPPLIIERPEPETPGRLCALNAESRRISEAW